MTEYHFEDLATYLQGFMDEHDIPSVRALARSYDLPRKTVARIFQGEKVDADSLVVIADKLGLPVETLYRLCGYLPSQETEAMVMGEIHALLSHLDPAQQSLVRDLVKDEVTRLKREARNRAASDLSSDTPKEEAA